MASIIINSLKNANIYVEGNSLAGRAENIQLPGIKVKFADHKALGLDSEIELPSGKEKMTGKVKWNSVYEDLIKTFGNPYVIKQVQVRGNLETHDSNGLSSQRPVVAFLNIRFKDVLPPITLNANDNPELETEFSCTYMRLEVAGEKVVEIDTMNNIFQVGTEDILQTFRINLGL